MNRYVVKTNLPVNAKTVILGEKYADRLSGALKRLGIEVISLPDNPDIDDRLSGHADMSVFHMGENRMFCAGNLRGTAFARKMEDLGFELYFSDLAQNRSYPSDAVLNACGIGSVLIYSRSVTDSRLLELFSDGSDGMISVRQGYCNCNICAISEKTVITSDAGISLTLADRGFEVLKIEPGYIDLDGFPYGFIGGCSFMITENKLAFTGTLNDHPDKEKILDYLKLKGVEPIFLTDDKAFDIGSAIPILEK